MRGQDIEGEKLAKAAKEKRQERGLSQRALGKEFKLSQSAISLIETGQIERLEEEKVEKILSYLGLSIAEFRKGEKGAVAPTMQKEVSPMRPVAGTIVKRVESRPAAAAPSAPSSAVVRHEPQERRSPVAGFGAVPVAGRGTPGRMSQDKREAFKPEHTGKERERLWEWVRNRTPIEIKLVNGELFKGYLKWYDQYAVKLVTSEGEIMIPKHSILFYFEQRQRRFEEPGG